jgi:spermidine synthase
MGNSGGTVADPKIRFVEREGEVTLFIDDHQAMQGWEQDLMVASADLLCQYGSTFFEVGLGLGLSAVRIATHPNTRRHIVVEKYGQVIQLFKERHPNLPDTLEIVEADFFDYVQVLEPSSLDGIFFDPWLPRELADNEDLWQRVMPLVIRALKPGGAFIPFFTTRPELKWPFYQFFDQIIVEKRAFTAYSTTEYTHGTSGDAYIQCFVRSRSS